MGPQTEVVGEAMEVAGEAPGGAGGANTVYFLQGCWTFMFQCGETRVCSFHDGQNCCAQAVRQKPRKGEKTRVSVQSGQANLHNQGKHSLRHGSRGCFVVMVWTHTSAPANCIQVSIHMTSSTLMISLCDLAVNRQTEKAAVLLAMKHLKTGELEWEQNQRTWQYSNDSDFACLSRLASILTM